MSIKRNPVTIKGIKDGLVFRLDEQCDFAELLDALKEMIEHSHQAILSGPLVAIDVRFGKRELSDEQKLQILDVLRSRRNLLVRSIEGAKAEEVRENAVLRMPMFTMSGMVRSGQVLRHDGNLLFLGDVNPGGTIVCTGDIYILGALRGMAHAGSEGGEQAVIGASHFAPTQLRIAEVISRPPDSEDAASEHPHETQMEFAYLKDGQMQIDKMANIARLRRDLNVFKGV
ncbi:septum site-determining protein MinC [Saccharibacillus sp. CPCC 101409]|uniref:septum site-determining protein MinC n=1 Tax=Saccharibacillus sp. CPCC 101409 TaxID=3058041 RepID=UPI0026737A50|nr:septum site-determining protein MinC [Saccharibacillus sp. CPCC 101409]MDO3410179.1 septum site-determining protein MinC [Saccharibacillus sp. CPCC 101409]